MTALTPETSDALRLSYIDRFIDTSAEHYKNTIRKTTMFIDGPCYTGYLWDCLRSPTVISEHQADRLLKKKRDIYMMWDIHSCERILTPHYWTFPKTAVLYAKAWSETFQTILPEDIYVFDDTLRWSIIYTHETNIDDSRYCLSALPTGEGERHGFSDPRWGKVRPIAFLQQERASLFDQTGCPR